MVAFSQREDRTGTILLIICGGFLMFRSLSLRGIILVTGLMTLLRGEPLDLVARQMNMSVARLTEWRDRALSGIPPGWAALFDYSYPARI
jgi:hypothetical protein